MLCGSLDERGVSERMGTCIYMAEPLCCGSETITILLIRSSGHLMFSYWMTYWITVPWTLLLGILWCVLCVFFFFLVWALKFFSFSRAQSPFWIGTHELILILFCCILILLNSLSLTHIHTHTHTHAYTHTHTHTHTVSFQGKTSRAHSFQITRVILWKDYGSLGFYFLLQSSNTHSTKILNPLVTYLIWNRFTIYKVRKTTSAPSKSYWQE